MRKTVIDILLKFFNQDPLPEEYMNLEDSSGFLNNLFEDVCFTNSLVIARLILEIDHEDSLMKYSIACRLGSTKIAQFISRNYLQHKF